MDSAYTLSIKKMSLYSMDSTYPLLIKNDKWRRKTEVFLEEALHLGLIKIRRMGLGFQKNEG